MKLHETFAKETYRDRNFVSRQELAEYTAEKLVRLVKQDHPELTDQDDIFYEAASYTGRFTNEIHEAVRKLFRD
jgi:hypothetical protein